MYAKVNETRIFFDVNGKQFVPDGNKMKKKPVCFVLHGGPGADHSLYVPALDPITEYMQLVYIDWRGNGRSDYPDESTYTIKQNVEDLEALRQYLGLDKIVILGQSYGGIMGEAYATTYPENLHGLVLITTAPSYHLFGRAQEELRKRGTPEQIEMADKYFWPGKFPNNEKFYEYWVLFSNMYAVKQVSAEEFAEAFGRVVLSYKAINMGFSGDLKTFNFLEDLHKITCPTLLIGGRQDWVTPIECTHEISSRIPDCKTVILENSSHSIFTDQYDESIKAITDFVADRL